MKNLPYLYFDNRYRKTLCMLEDVYQQIFLTTFHENSTLPGEVDSIFKSADSLPQKLNQHPPIRSDFHETLLGVSAGDYIQVYRKFFFRYLLSKED